MAVRWWRRRCRCGINVLQAVPLPGEALCGGAGRHGASSSRRLSGRVRVGCLGVVGEAAAVTMFGLFVPRSQPRCGGARSGAVGRFVGCVLGAFGRCGSSSWTAAVAAFGAGWLDRCRASVQRQAASAVFSDVFGRSRRSRGSLSAGKIPGRRATKIRLRRWRATSSALSAMAVLRSWVCWCLVLLLRRCFGGGVDRRRELGSFAFWSPLS